MSNGAPHEYVKLPNWLTQLIVTGLIAAFSSYMGVKVGFTELKARQEGMEERMDRLEDKVDRLIERRP